MVPKQEMLNSKILIIDDQEINILLLEDILAKAGFTSIVTTTDSRDAVKLYKDHEPDIILVDLNMPEINGFEVMKKIREMEGDSYIPILAMTSQPAEELLIESLKAGATDFLRKPFNILEVVCRIKNMLNVRILQKRQKEHRNLLESIISDLTKTGASLSANKNIDSLLESVIYHARKLTNADAGTLYILKDNVLHFQIIQNETLGNNLGGPTGDPINLPPVEIIESNVSGYVALKGETVNIADVYHSDLFNFEGPKKFDAATGYRSQSMLVVPMKNHENDIVGVFQLLNSKDPNTGEVGPFSVEAENIAVAVASQAALALNNAILVRDMEKLFEAFVEVMATAIDEKSPVTGNHIRRMSNLTLEMADVINEISEGPFKDQAFDENQIYQLRLACLMHDIGKVTTPVEIVEKGKKLETVFNRIEHLDMRLCYIKQKTTNACMGQKLKLLQENANEEVLKKVDEENQNKLNELEEIRQFLRRCNEPGEYLADEMVDRLKSIAKMTYTDDEGVEQNYLSQDELKNLSIRKGSITEEERKIMQNHASVSLKMLEQIPFTKKLKDVPIFAGAHHESPNGKGYPLGLKGDEIPFEGKLLAVADIAEALTAADRPYKKAMPVEVVNRILRDMASKEELDSDLVELFINQDVYGRYKNKLENKTELA